MSWQPASRYPDPSVISVDSRFDKYRIPLTAVERLAGGMRWCEGPVWFGDHHCLLWSDLPNNRILRWDERTGETAVFRSPSNFTNGNTRDHLGRLVSCEHGGRRVTRTEYDGSVTVLADSYQGKRLNSPNDVVVSSDGSVWFTDPAFGIAGDYEGHRAEPELPTNLYRVDAASGELTVAAAGIPYPNGLAFSPDESVLYVVASRWTPNRAILALEVTDGRRLGEPTVLIDAQDGVPDGLRIDEDGNLWCGWGMGTDELDGVRVFTPGGELIGRIALPERCANVAFGGPRRNRLFMAAGTSLYALYVNTRGVR